MVNSRKYGITTDMYGVDPLQDKLVDRIGAIDTYVLYDVKQSQRGRPDVIAHTVYRNSHLWWVVLYYNGITNFKDIKEGVTLKLPLANEVTRVLAEAAAQTRSYPKTVII